MATTTKLERSSQSSIDNRPGGDSLALSRDVVGSVTGRGGGGWELRRGSDQRALPHRQIVNRQSSIDNQLGSFSPAVQVAVLILSQGIDFRVHRLEFEPGDFLVYVVRNGIHLVLESGSILDQVFD